MPRKARKTIKKRAVKPADKPDLPGYYYDTERQRYFRIFQNGIASTSNYTVSILKDKAQAEENARKVDAFQQKTKTSNGFYSLIQSRTQNARPPQLDCYYPHLLKRYALDTTLKSPGYPRHISRDITSFDIDREHSALYTARSLRNSGTTIDVNHLSFPWSVGPDQHLYYSEGYLTSLNVYPSATDETLLLATFLENSGDSLTLLRGDDPVHFPKLQKYPIADIWNASMYKTNIAFGSLFKLYTIDLTSESVKKYSLHESLHSDCLAIHYSVDERTLMTGFRNGHVQLIDTRSKVSMPGFKEKSSVSHLQFLPNSEILFVTGLMNGELNLYDVRNFKKITSYKGHQNGHLRLEFDFFHSLIVARTLIIYSSGL